MKFFSARAWGLPWNAPPLRNPQETPDSAIVNEMGKTEQLDLGGWMSVQMDNETLVRRDEVHLGGAR